MFVSALSERRERANVLSGSINGSYRLLGLGQLLHELLALVGRHSDVLLTADALATNHRERHTTCSLGCCAERSEGRVCAGDIDGRRRVGRADLELAAAQLEVVHVLNGIRRGLLVLELNETVALVLTGLGVLSREIRHKRHQQRQRK